MTFQGKLFIQSHLPSARDASGSEQEVLWYESAEEYRALQNQMKEKTFDCSQDLRLTPAGALAGMGRVTGQFLAGTEETHVRNTCFLESGFKKILQHGSLLLKVFTVLCCSHYRCCVFYLVWNFFFEMCLLWFILILVVNDVLESLKLESKPPSPENMVGRQSA